jgi:hypothetical protein
MVLQKKKLRKVIALELKIAFAILVVVLLAKDTIKPFFKMPVMEYVGTHIDFLKTVILFVFLFCSLFLIIIVWLLEWGDQQQKSVVTQYISRMVCQNYYGNYRKTNVYKAIKTCLSKFSRDAVSEQGGVKTDDSRAPTRYIDTSRFAIKKYSPEELSTSTSTTNDDGIQRNYFPNGKIEKEVSYKNNVPDGLYRTFYEDGTLHQERFYKNGKLNGIYKAYDEFGVLYFDTNYQDDKQEGITNIYYKNGCLQYRDTYKNGKRIHRDTYSDTGELKFSQEEYND